MHSPGGPGGIDRERSVEALDRRAGHPPLGGGAFWPAAAILLVLAGSLSPYAFDLNTVNDGRAWGPLAIGWPASNVNDLVTNVVVYLPIGLTLCLWLRPRVGFAYAALAATAVGGLAGFTAESLQTLVPQRTPSWIDVSVNQAGAALGALIAPLVASVGRAAGSRLRARLSASPVSVAATVAAVVLLVAGLWPLDFVTDTEQLHRSLADARWAPWIPPAAPGPGGILRHDVPATLGLAGMFAVFGFLVALAGRESGSLRRDGFETAAGHAAIMALLIETVQIFVCSRSFDVMDAILNTVTAALGAYLALVAVDAPSRSGWVGQPSVLLRPLLLVPLLLAQGAYHVLDAMWVSQPSGAAAGPGTVYWLPFSGYYGHALAATLAQAAWICAASALFALTVAALLRLRGERIRWLVAVVATVGLAAVCEAIQFFGPARLADTTEPVLAAGGVLLAATAWHHLRPKPPAAAALDHTTDGRVPIVP
jgi:VanZ family protein